MIFKLDACSKILGHHTIISVSVCGYLKDKIIILRYIMYYIIIFNKIMKRAEMALLKSSGEYEEL